MSRPAAQTVIDGLGAVVTPEETELVREACQEAAVSEDVKNYMMDIVEATRRERGFVCGVSTRGAIALYRASQAAAVLAGRDYVIPEDVKRMAPPVLAHRLSTAGGVAGEGAGRLLDRLLDQVPVPLETP